MMGDAKVHPSDAVVTIENEIFKHFAIQWKDLTYTVYKSFLERKLASITGQRNVQTAKQIIKNVKGTIKSGELTAIMGPSGAGKSTLLECIAAIRERGCSGQIKFHGNANKINLAFIPQHDTFFGVLTVKESLLFASKLQNSTRAKNGDDYMAFTVAETKDKPRLTRKKTISEGGFHEDIAFNIMSLLGLEEVADVPTRSISGGQKKRLSIAQELVSKPNILILDEPTSGLDSSASMQCIQLLQKLTQQKLPMAIVCTIHQPNPKTFNLFHRVFILSVIGKCIYEGPPTNLVDHLKQVEIECPSFYNPADFIIEVASGEHGFEAVDKLVVINDTAPLPSMATFQNSCLLEEVTVQPKFPFFSHFLYLFHRSFILILRNPLLTSLRFISHVFLALFIGWIYGPNVGKSGGCPPDMAGGFTIEGMQAATNASIEQGKMMIDNFSCLFFNMMIIMFSALMPTLISFPMEMLVFVKEKRNNWYGVGSYFLGMLIADTPFQLAFPAMYVLITYFMTGQITVLWRFESYLLVNILIALISQCQGLIMGAIFMHNMTAAVYIGPLTALPMLLFSGFLVKIETMPQILKPLCNLSFIRFSFEAAIISIYGFDRCGEDVNEKIESMRQLLLGWFGRMLSIVQRALHEEEDYSDYGGTASKNITVVSSIDGNDDMSSMAGALVDTIIAGVGGGMRDEEGNIVSGVMALFDLTDNRIYDCYIALGLYFILLRVSTYFFVRWRANAKD